MLYFLHCAATPRRNFFFLGGGDDDESAGAPNEGYASTLQAQTLPLEVLSHRSAGLPNASSLGI